MKIKNIGNKGITLVALVITIIVILILAGISIAMLTGENGILTKAREAKEKTEIATYEEELKLIGNGLKAEQVDDNEYLDRYKEEIEKDEMFKNSDVELSNDNTKLTVTTEEGYIFEITKDNVEYIGKGDRPEVPEEPDEPEIEIPELQEGDITFSYNPSEPTNGDVEVTIETSLELGDSWIEYSTNNGTDWTKYENPIIVTKNGEIYARISNSAGSSVNTATGNVENIDKLDPNEPTLQVTGVTENSITVVANAEDQAQTEEYASSGIKGYQFSKDNGNTWEPTTPQASGTYTFSNLTENTSYTLKVKAIDNVNNEKEIENAVTGTTKHKTIETTTSFVGNYADTNGDGIADGIIFADLAVGGSGSWGDKGWGNYSISTKTRLKEYYVKEESYNKTPKFGNKEGKLIVPKEGATGEDRFYIMALEDINPGTYYCWYNDAYGKLDKIISYSTNDFGEGKENTDYVMDKWTSKNWGTQNTGEFADMWGAIQTQVNQGWFVPSRAEWSAFADNLEITTSNYNSYGLKGWYWSSSQSDTIHVYDINFKNNRIDNHVVRSNYYVRLCMTF